MVGNDRTEDDQHLIRRSIRMSEGISGVVLLAVGVLTWTTDMYGAAFGLLAGALYIAGGIRARKRVRNNPDEILRNNAALKERDRRLPLWRHAVDWVTLLLGAALGAFVMATIVASDYGAALTGAWLVATAVFLAIPLAILVWSVRRFIRRYQ